MIKQNLSLSDAKKYVCSLKDKSFDVRVNLGRNKIVIYPATLSGVYPALFTVSPLSAFKGKTSFSYSELLCGGVKLRERKAE